MHQDAHALDTVHMKYERKHYNHSIIDIYLSGLLAVIPFD